MPIRELRHELTRPADAEGVLLNEDLVFYFSEELDRASVTRGSVQIVSESGVDARGRLVVEGKRVRFVPTPVLAHDLSDGGYLPGTRYRVEIRGFPSPDGLRGVHGEPLRATYRWSFRTVEVADPRRGLIFDDRNPDKQSALRLFPSPAAGEPGGAFIGPRDAIYLACDKPLDPSTLRDEDFLLRPLAREGRRPVGLRARLIENQPEPHPRARQAGVRSSAPLEFWERERRAALIELTPVEGLEPGDYLLTSSAPKMEVGASLRDFGGGRAGAAYVGSISIRVADRVSDASAGSLTEEFIDTRLRSPVAVPDFDGTAYWGDTGRVELRYPAAAGDGSAGSFELEEHEARADVHAIRLRLPKGRRCELSPKAGLVVLRAQGRLTIEGDLARTLATTERDDMQFEPGESLSSWMARAAPHSWTILVAGGDLVIEGSVRTTTPLLLCAGGVIRVSGRVQAAQQQLFLLGEGGGLSIEPAERSKAPPLVIDPPTRNLLVEPIRFAVLSGLIPPRGGVARWLSAEASGSPSGRDRTGSWSVRYVPELGPEHARVAPVHNPRLFERPAPLQLWIELEVEPGVQWEPPYVDSVRLSWEQSAGREAPK
ncbi:MAG: Ig-like domain-containing protein [Planctomycetota bacterium]